MMRIIYIANKINIQSVVPPSSLVKNIFYMYNQDLCICFRLKMFNYYIII